MKKCFGTFLGGFRLYVRTDSVTGRPRDWRKPGRPGLTEPAETKPSTGRPPLIYQARSHFDPLRALGCRLCARLGGALGVADLDLLAAGPDTVTATVPSST